MLHSSIRDFVRMAARGPADCTIDVSQLVSLYHALADGLRATGMSTGQIVDAVNAKLLGVCAECATWTGGQGIGMIAATDTIGGMAFIGPTGGAERFARGMCRNSTCSARRILIFWRPDEDDAACERLARMGIEIDR